MALQTPSHRGELGRAAWFLSRERIGRLGVGAFGQVDPLQASQGLPGIDHTSSVELTQLSDWWVIQMDPEGDFRFGV